AGRGGAGPGKFVSQLRSPGAPAVAAQVPSAGVGMELPAVSLQMILLVHWLLTTWGCITFSGPYPWANFTILAVGVWAVAQRDSVDAISLPCEEALPSYQPRCVLTSLARFSAGSGNPENPESVGCLPREKHGFSVAWRPPSSWTLSTSASSTSRTASRTHSASAPAWPSSACSSSPCPAASSTTCTGSAGVSSRSVPVSLDRHRSAVTTRRLTHQRRPQTPL
ncbi:unnamed protein product, partial [Gulo gulo]